MERNVVSNLWRASAAWLVCSWILQLDPNAVIAQQPIDSGPKVSVRVLTLDGAVVEGNLLAADDKKVAIESAGETRAWTGAEVLRVEFGNSQASASEPLEIGLVDGARYRGSKLVGKEQAWEFGDTSGASLAFGPGVVRSLLVRNVTGDMAKAWTAALQESADSDSLILIRPGNATDRINGLIVEVKDGKVAFDLDGQVVDVPFEKLVGMIWFRKLQERIKPAIEISMIDGGVAYAESLSFEGDRIVYRSGLGTSASVPAARIVALNYSYANLKWLYDVPPLEAQATKRLDWKGVSKAVERAVAPRFVSSQSVSSQSDRTQAAAPDFDLVFPAPGSFTFRVPDGFVRFQSTLERSDTGDQRSELTIEIWQDDVRLASKGLGVSDDSVLFDLPVAAGKKVRLSVVSEGRLMIGTQATWKQPRLAR